MNFKISSAPDKRLSEEDYQKFKDDYLNSSLTWHELRKKYKLSKKEHSETCKEYEWDLDKCKAFIEKVKLDRRNLL